MLLPVDAAAGAGAPIGFGRPVQRTTSMPRWMSSAAMKYVFVPSALFTILNCSAAHVLAFGSVNELASRNWTCPCAVDEVVDDLDPLRVVGGDEALLTRDLLDHVDVAEGLCGHHRIADVDRLGAAGRGRVVDVGRVTDVERVRAAVPVRVVDPGRAR